MERRITRRQALQAAGAGGAALLAARAGLLPRLAAAEPAAAASCATLTPTMTEGPYWVDELLRRSDVRAGQAGVPLALKIAVLDAGNACAPVSGAHVDIWHSNAQGVYSDVGSAKGETFLRGYQVSDADGLVTFRTVWPGWYQGRTIHIHVRVRTYNAAGSVATDYTTQIFFAESDNTAVLTGAAPYNARSPQLDPTRNANDNILGSNSATNILDASGSPSAGYAGTFTIMLSGGSSSSAPTASDKAVSATLSSAKVVGRSVVLSVHAGETLTARARLLHGSTVIGSATGKLTAGTHSLRVAARSAGTAKLELTLADAAGNTRVVRRTLRFP